MHSWYAQCTRMRGWMQALRTCAIAEPPSISPNDFLSNTAAREADFTDQFWHHIYTLYLAEVDSDPSRSFLKYDIERTIRVTVQQGRVDVLIRPQPEPREERVMRFTAFPAGDEQKTRQVSRVYRRDETRPVLGEAVLPDAGWRW